MINAVLLLVVWKNWVCLGFFPSVYSFVGLDLIPTLPFGFEMVCYKDTITVSLGILLEVSSFFLCQFHHVVISGMRICGLQYIFVIYKREV